MWVRQKPTLLCKIFEYFALQVDPIIEFIQLRSTPFKDSGILAPKLADPPFLWKSNSTPSKSECGYLIRINWYVVLFMDVCYLKYSYLETRSRCVNTSFIIKGFTILSSRIPHSPLVKTSFYSLANLIKLFWRNYRCQRNKFVKVFFHFVNLESISYKTMNLLHDFRIFKLNLIKTNFLSITNSS